MIGGKDRGKKIEGKDWGGTDWRRVIGGGGWNDRGK